MSTPSIIGTTNGTTFKGIYCNYDGYPTHMGRALAEIITRDGADAIPVLTGAEARARAGKPGVWDSIAPEMPAPDTVLPYPDRSTYLNSVDQGDADAGVFALYVAVENLSACIRRDEGEQDPRDYVVEGYGSILKAGGVGLSGTLHSACPTSAGEWAYLFDENLTLHVYESLDSLSEVAQFTVADMAAIASGDEDAVKRLSHAECGENYERCSHVAWAHDPDAPEESQRLGMLAWLGREPIPERDAVAVIVGGTRYEVTGSSQIRNGRLSLHLQGGDDLPVAKTDRRGNVVALLPGIELVMPPTKPELAKAGA